jgi:predicted RNase H-like HicB family nuclease
MKSYKINAIIEKDDHGYYAFCPELEGCCTQGRTLDETMKNIHEAISLYLETLSPKERASLTHRELITSSLEVCMPIIQQIMIQASFESFFQEVPCN